MGLSRRTERRIAIESEIIIGVIDSGIWPESESFSDQGFGPIPAKWKGSCDGGITFVCNRKIIGARTFSVESRELSARDKDGHGTHVASIVAGNQVGGASYYGLADGVARGGVPSARLAIYKVCDPDCADTDILSAFDHAIADGVDIISVSLGHKDPPELTFDPIAIGAFHAIEKGILTVQAAGNDGPSLLSINSYAPWILTVGASYTDRKIVDKILLGAKDNIIVGNAINIFPSSDEASPLVYGKDVTSNCSETKARKPHVKILRSESVDNLRALFAASFSSRGPSRYMYDIIKPDVIAPGVEILAAFPPTDLPSGVALDINSLKFSILSGTSMACPHVSAAAAFVKSYRPEWSPSAIKSALMTTVSLIHCVRYYVTAWEFDASLNPEAEFAYGSGHIDPIKATNPGLVYETFFQEYHKIWCNISRTPGSVIPTNASCPTKLTPKEINYPSMAAQVQVRYAFVVSFPRIVTNVGQANSAYVATIEGNPSNFRFKVEPNTMRFMTQNEKKNFVVTVWGKGMKPQTIKRTSLLWTDGVHRVRSPIVIYTMGTSNGQRVLTTSKFQIIIILLIMTIVLMC
ncbi:hypothetical protein QVD17_21182 [Tagetes erecta]|uniref:Uncharacterized protein n=1 Tax=Tagetes erecta TaxID=13708 RepID=A0AAD8NYV3_TARER|nr:hypothetical protein QVD17_21182 [Tagetes erecta]